MLNDNEDYLLMICVFITTIGFFVCISLCCNFKKEEDIEFNYVVEN